MFRFVCFLAFVAACNAGIANYAGASIIAPTVTSEQQNVLRSYGNLQQVAYNSKSIETPYSSVHKSDVRVSNPGYQVQKQIAYAAPAHTTYVQSAPSYVQSAPSYVHAAPSTYSAHSTYSAPVVAHQPAVYHQPAVAVHQPVAYHQPAYQPTVVAAAPAHAPTYAYSPSYSQYSSQYPQYSQQYSAHAAPATKTLLGVAYSPANVVSHMSYSAPLVSYGW